MTGPVPLGGFNRRRRSGFGEGFGAPPDFALDERRYDEAVEFGEATDEMDRAIGAGQPQAPPQSSGLRRLLEAAPSLIARSFASNLDPQGGGVERFLGGVGRGFVDVEDQRLAQAEQAREAENDRSLREGRSQRLKLDLLDTTLRQREIDQRNRPPAPFSAETDVPFQRHRASRDYDIANPLPGSPIRPEWEEQGFPDQGSYLRWLRQKTAATDKDPGGSGTTRFPPGSPEHRQAWVLTRVREIGKPDAFGERPSVEEAEQRAIAEYERAYPPPPKPVAPVGRPGWQGPRRSAPPKPVAAQPADDQVATQRRFWDAAAAQLTADGDQNPAATLGPRP